MQREGRTRWQDSGVAGSHLGLRAGSNSGRRVRGRGGQSSSERWTHRLDRMAIRIERSADQLSRLVDSADRAGVLMPELSRRLIDASRTATQVLIKSTERLAWKSDVREAKPLPSAEAATTGVGN